VFKKSLRKLSFTKGYVNLQISIIFGLNIQKLELALLDICTISDFVDSTRVSSIVLLFTLDGRNARIYDLVLFKIHTCVSYYSIQVSLVYLAWWAQVDENKLKVPFRVHGGG
jgi:hypothetical protein